MSTTMPYGKVNASYADKNSITNHWRNRTPFKGSSVTGYDRSTGIPFNAGRMPHPHSAQYLADFAAGRIDYAIFSYGTPIAWVLADGTEVKPPVKYSVTTSKHQGRIY